MKRAFTLLSALVIAFLPLFSFVNTPVEAKLVPGSLLDNQERTILIPGGENTKSLYLGLDQMTDFEVDEFEKIWLTGIVPDSWLGKNLNNAIAGSEFYDLWRAFTVKTLGIPENELDSTCWDWIKATVQDEPAVGRGTAGMLYVFAFLKDQLKLNDYDSFEAGMTTSTGRGSLYNALISEILDPDYNAYRAQNGGQVWGSVLATITKDMVSGAPMFDVDQYGYVRLTDNLTYKEALQMLYRFSRSNRWVATPTGTISFDVAAVPISLTEEQKAMANAMPLPTYENLPDWQGIWVTGDHGYDVKYQYEDDYRTIAELGFNHLRYTIMANELLKADHTQFDAQILHTLDTVIGYAIKYGIHLSLNIKASNDNQNEILVNFSKHAYLKEMYRALASRYQEVPSNALSFYMFFEPAVNDAYAASDPSSYVTDTRYAEICFELADVIWSKDADRLISVDGITFGREPSMALAAEGVRRKASQDKPGLGAIVQSFHYFINGATWTNGFYGEAPSLVSWPQPYVQNALYSGGQTIKVAGNSTGFPAGTTVKVTQTHNVASPAYLALNVDSTKVIDGSSVTFTLNQAANLLALSSTTSSNYNEVDKIWITYPFAAVKPIPIFGFFTDTGSTDTYTDEVGGDMGNFNTNILPGLLNGMPLKSILGTLIRRFETRQIVVITCGADFLYTNDWGSVSTTVSITDDFGYTSDSLWGFGPEFTRKFLKPWLDYEKTYHTEAMLTEFAANNGSTEEIMAAILDEELSVMKENGIAWGGVAGFNNFNGGVFDDYVYNGNYQRWRTHWYDVARMQVLHKNMTTFDVSEIGRQTFTGRELTPQVTVSFDGSPLIEGTDYTLSYFDNLDYGSAVIRILGIGRYSGMSRTVCFTISPFNKYFALPALKIYVPFIKK